MCSLVMCLVHSTYLLTHNDIIKYYIDGSMFNLRSTWLLHGDKTLNLDMSSLQYMHIKLSFVACYILLCHSLLRDSVFILTLMLSISTIV